MSLPIFYAYNSIENSYNTKNIKYIQENISSSDEWIATEKIHGSNCSFIIDNELNISKASRNLLLNGSATMHSLHLIQDKYKENIINLRKLLLTKNIITDKSIVHIFGEHFGGYYPGMKNKHSAIQKGVIYSPEHEFLIFDILIREYILTTPTYLDYQLVVNLCKEVNLPYVPILAKGTLEELLKLNPLFESTIPNLLNYPQPSSNNFAEGYVLKPNRNIWLKCGSRVILKLKNPSFLERTKKIDTSKEQKGKVVSIYDDNIKTLVNKNRYDNIVSKDGNLSHPKTLIPIMIKDVYEDYKKEYINEADIADPIDEKLLKTSIARIVADFITSINKNL